MAVPGGLIEICFSFDTTGSMSGCINEVKGKVQDLIQRLQADIPGIRMAVFAHGDYCDKHNYITKHIDFSTNVADLCTWVKNVGSTGGGDGDECYELVLKEVQDLSWTPGSTRALVMIGDADPHEPGYTYGGKKYKIDWRNEAYNLMNMNVRIYGVSCRGYCSHKDFYNKLSTATGGKCLQLADFANMFDFMMAICYREHDETLLMNYENEVRARGKAVHKDLDAMFGKLREDAEVMDTVPPPLAKIPSLSKPKSVKKMKPCPKPVVKKVSKPKSPKFKPKHTKFMDKRDEYKDYKLCNLPKLKRERVPDKNFMISDAPWSKWELVITTEAKVPSDEQDLWEKRSSGDSKICSGCRKKVICGGRYKELSLYEFAVKTKFSGRKYVVYSKTRKPFVLTRGSWESKLLNNGEIRKQIDEVLKKGGIILARRCNLKKTSSLETTMSYLRHYDYAWTSQGKERPSSRPIAYRWKNN